MEKYTSESLINEVQKHPCLYAKSSTEYRNKIKRAKAWADISGALDIPGNECMTKWRSIRDRFNREIKKNLFKSGSAATVSESKFHYMEQLSFLKKYVSPRKTTSSVAASEEELPNVDEEDVDDILQISFPNEDIVDNSEGLEEELIIEETQPSFSFGDDICELPSTSSTSTLDNPSNGSRTKKVSAVEHSFKNFMEKMTVMHEKRLQILATKPNNHDGFFKIVSTKLEMLPLVAQEDAKMFFLNYLHDLVKNYN